MYDIENANDIPTVGEFLLAAAIRILVVAVVVAAVVAVLVGLPLYGLVWSWGL